MRGENEVNLSSGNVIPQVLISKDIAARFSLSKVLHISKNSTSFTKFSQYGEKRIDNSFPFTASRNVISFGRSSQFYNIFSGVMNCIIPSVHAADVDSDPKKEKRRAYIKELLSKETKEERLRRMFSKNEIGEVSPEIRYVINGAYHSFLVGVVLGALFSSSKAKEDFTRRNVATPFESAHIAKRKFADTVTLYALKNGLRYGTKLCFTTTTYLFITITAANYNNKVTLYEHIGAGAFFGSIARINFGLKGMAVAGGLGGFLGLCAGSVILGCMKAFDLTFEELRYWQHEYYQPEIQATLKAKNKGLEDI